MTGLGIFWRISRIGEGNIMTWRLVVEYWSYMILHDSSVCKLTICMWNINAEHNPWCFSNWRLPKSERHSVKNTHRVGRLRCFKEAHAHNHRCAYHILMGSRKKLPVFEPARFSCNIAGNDHAFILLPRSVPCGLQSGLGLIVFGGSTFEGAPHWKTRNLFLMEMHFEMIGNISKL